MPRPDLRAFFSPGAAEASGHPVAPSSLKWGALLGELAHSQWRKLGKGKSTWRLVGIIGFLSAV